MLIANRNKKLQVWRKCLLILIIWFDEYDSQVIEISLVPHIVLQSNAVKHYPLNKWHSSLCNIPYTKIQVTTSQLYNIATLPNPYFHEHITFSPIFPHFLFRLYLNTHHTRNTMLMTFSHLWYLGVARIFKIPYSYWRHVSTLSHKIINKTIWRLAILLMQW
jgi:hypothetical protein